MKMKEFGTREAGINGTPFDLPLELVVSIIDIC